VGRRDAQIQEELLVCGCACHAGCPSGTAGSTDYRERADLCTCQAAGRARQSEAASLGLKVAEGHHRSEWAVEEPSEDDHAKPWVIALILGAGWVIVAGLAFGAGDTKGWSHGVLVLLALLAGLYLTAITGLTLVFAMVVEAIAFVRHSPKGRQRRLDLVLGSAALGFGGLAGSYVYVAGPPDMVCIPLLILIGHSLGSTLPFSKRTRAVWQPRLSAYGIVAAIGAAVTGGLILVLSERPPSERCRYKAAAKAV